jgi:hypothetical protein
LRLELHPLLIIYNIIRFHMFRFTKIGYMCYFRML